MDSIGDLIESAGLTQVEVAVAAGIALSTVSAAKVANRWPVQRRPRQALARALGLQADPITGQPLSADGARPGIPIDTPEQARAVLAQRGHPVPQEA